MPKAYNGQPLPAEALVTVQSGTQQLAVPIKELLQAKDSGTNQPVGGGGGSLGNKVHTIRVRTGAPGDTYYDDLVANPIPFDSDMILTERLPNGNVGYPFTQNLSSTLTGIPAGYSGVRTYVLGSCDHGAVGIPSGRFKGFGLFISAVATGYDRSADNGLESPNLSKTNHVVQLGLDIGLESAEAGALWDYNQLDDVGVWVVQFHNGQVVSASVEATSLLTPIYKTALTQIATQGYMGAGAGRVAYQAVGELAGYRWEDKASVAASSRTRAVYGGTVRLSAYTAFAAVHETRLIYPSWNLNPINAFTGGADTNPAYTLLPGEYVIFGQLTAGFIPTVERFFSTLRQAITDPIPANAPSTQLAPYISAGVLGGAGSIIPAGSGHMNVLADILDPASPTQPTAAAPVTMQLKRGNMQNKPVRFTIPNVALELVDYWTTVEPPVKRLLPLTDAEVAAGVGYYIIYYASFDAPKAAAFPDAAYLDPTYTPVPKADGSGFIIIKV